MFKQALAEMVERTEGATGALIMGMDGIAVERVLLPEGSDGKLEQLACAPVALRANPHAVITRFARVYTWSACRSVACWAIRTAR